MLMGNKKWDVEAAFITGMGFGFMLCVIFMHWPQVVR